MNYFWLVKNISIILLLIQGVACTLHANDKFSIYEYNEKTTNFINNQCSSHIISNINTKISEEVSNIDELVNMAIYIRDGECTDYKVFLSQLNLSDPWGQWNMMIAPSAGLESPPLINIMPKAGPTQSPTADVPFPEAEIQKNRKIVNDQFAANRESIKLLENIVNNYPKLTRAKLELALSYKEIGNYESAENLLMPILDSPDTPTMVRLRILSLLAEIKQNKNGVGCQ